MLPPASKLSEGPKGEEGVPAAQATIDIPELQAWGEILRRSNISQYCPNPTFVVDQLETPSLDHLRDIVRPSLIHVSSSSEGPARPGGVQAPPGPHQLAPGDRCRDQTSYHHPEDEMADHRWEVAHAGVAGLAIQCGMP